MISGESVPVIKGVGQEVLAGTIAVMEGASQEAVQITVQHTVENTALSRIIKLVEQAQVIIHQVSFLICPLEFKGSHSKACR
jgi:cation transport ATPase